MCASTELAWRAEIAQYCSLFFCWTLKDGSWEEFCGKLIAQKGGHLISSSKISASEVCQFGFVLVLHLKCMGLNFNVIKRIPFVTFQVMLHCNAGISKLGNLSEPGYRVLFLDMLVT